MRSLRRDVPVLHAEQSLRDALRLVIDSGLPALPVVDSEERYVGVFGEREFLGALFPGYLKTLGYAGFVPDDLDDALEQRSTCLSERVADHINSEHVDLPPDGSNTSIAETFLHHRVLIVPVVEDRRVVGVVTRTEFFRQVAEKVLGGGG